MSQPEARIFQLNGSDGGVPKLPMRRAEARTLGMEGDRQRNTKVHGGPERALCLYSLERILALQAEGHPILPGDIGENVTISGLDWDEIEPGSRLRLGETVEVEVTGWAEPCSQIKAAFRGGEVSRIDAEAHPGWARAYVRVLTEGPLEVADPVRLG